jgi:hypothetical protein
MGSDTRWIEAPEVKDIAERLIMAHHPNLELWMDEIRYVFRNEAAKSKGKTVFGKAHKVTALACYLATNSPGDMNSFDDSPPPPADMFVMEIAHDVWEVLTREQREALVDHELQHMDVLYAEDGSFKRVIRPHDIEEFNAIVQRHGAWRPDIKDFADALQLRLNVESE